MSAEHVPRRLSRVGTGGETPKLSKNAHLPSTPRTPRNADRTGQSGSVFNLLKDKWDHKDLSEDGLQKIFDLIIEELKKGKPSIAGVERFLRDEQAVDDCVKWYLLFYAIGDDKKDKEDERKARLQLIELLVKDKAYLAFENMNNPDGPAKLYKERCQEPKWHPNLKERRTPLHMAILECNSSAVRTMIEQGKKFYDEKEGDYSRGQSRAVQMASELPNFSVENCQLVNIIKQPDCMKTTPFDLACSWDSGHCEMIYDLLEFADIDTANRKFHDALQDGKHDAVEAFLRRSKVAGEILTNEVVLKALQNIETPVKNCRGSENYSAESKKKVAKLMVKSLKSSEFNRKIAETIIQHDAMDLWTAHDEKKLGADLQACLLHLAVRNKRPRFVHLFVKNYPWSVTTKWAHSEGSGERYPLWYNNHDEKGVRYKGNFDDDRAKIRTEIITKMIEEESEMGALFDMFSSCAGKADTEPISV